MYPDGIEKKFYQLKSTEKQYFLFKLKRKDMQLIPIKKNVSIQMKPNRKWFHLNETKLKLNPQGVPKNIYTL